ncbi:MAG TPA: RluA family pseudouridine synthase [Candidatus Paceibacterota bacterium]|nr:RluA family pseudouridine synthase [Candidatus Paceibacterota bacterium]
MKKALEVEKSLFPQRIDLYLKNKLSDISRSKIVSLLKQGKILINEKKVKPSFILKGGEKILINFHEEKKELIPLPLEREPEILYEDKNYLVINKPAGILVHPNLKNLNQPTISSWLIFKWPNLKGVGEDPLRPGIVHRLDKETSGVLAIAKNNQSFFHLKEQFQKRLVKKEYLTLVWGNIKKDSGEINIPLTYSKKSPFRRKISNFKSPKKSLSAITYYKVIKRFKDFALLKVIPKTGRTHQIRVHLASLGFPVVGDKEYGPKNRRLPFTLNRQFLHAIKISFLTIDNTLLEIEAPLPEDLENVLKLLR